MWYPSTFGAIGGTLENPIPPWLDQETKTGSGSTATSISRYPRASEQFGYGAANRRQCETLENVICPCGRRTRGGS